MSAVRPPRVIAGLIADYPQATATLTGKGHWKIRVAPGAPFLIVGADHKRRTAGRGKNITRLRRIAEQMCVNSQPLQ